MLCKKCGTENPDGAKYCSKCGKALNEKSTAKKNREKGIVLALCVIVAVVLLVYTLGGRSYKKTIDTFVTSQFAVDAQSIVELLPEKVLDKELEETGYSKTELVEETNDSLKKQVDYIDQYLGDDWKLSYKMTNVEDVTGDDLNDLKSNYEDINALLEQCGKQIVDREITKGYVCGLTKGVIPKPRTEDIVPAIEKWAVFTYAKLLAEQIFVPITTEDKNLMYAPFQCIAQYFLSKGYGGIVYSSTVFPEGKNVVLFDKIAAHLYGAIRQIVIDF